MPALRGPSGTSGPESRPKLFGDHDGLYPHCRTERPRRAHSEARTKPPKSARRTHEKSMQRPSSAAFRTNYSHAHAPHRQSAILCFRKASGSKFRDSTETNYIDHKSMFRHLMARPSHPARSIQGRRSSVAQNAAGTGHVRQLTVNNHCRGAINASTHSVHPAFTSDGS